APAVHRAGDAVGQVVLVRGSVRIGVLGPDQPPGEVVARGGAVAVVVDRDGRAVDAIVDELLGEVAKRVDDPGDVTDRVVELGDGLGQRRADRAGRGHQPALGVVVVGGAAAQLVGLVHEPAVGVVRHGRGQAAGLGDARDAPHGVDGRGGAIAVGVGRDG